MQGGGVGDGVALSVAEGDVSNSEGFRVLLQGAGLGVFANAKQEIEGYVDQVCGGKLLSLDGCS